MYIFQSRNKYLGNNRQIPKQKLVIISKYLPKIYFDVYIFYKRDHKVFYKTMATSLAKASLSKNIIFS